MALEALQRFIDEPDPAFRDGDAEARNLDVAVDMFHKDAEFENAGPPPSLSWEDGGDQP